MTRGYRAIVLSIFILGNLFSGVEITQAAGEAESILDRIGTRKGICMIVGDSSAGLALAMARQSELLIYLQFSDRKKATAVSAAFEKEGLLGNRIYVNYGRPDGFHLAENVADAVIVHGTVKGFPKDLLRSEALRVVNPNGKVLLGNEVLSKPFPKGIDAWSHPFHGPNNNPLSTDQIAHAPYKTQFLAGPWSFPLPTLTVGAGGRLFRAMGHHATSAYQNELLNSLVCFNAYNGRVLWRRPLKKGFIIF